MSKCQDERFQAMLHGYELDMLSDEGRRQFEIHMMECDDCFDRAERFRHTARLLNQDDDIRQVVSQADDHDRIVSPTRPTSRSWIGVARISLVAAAVMVVLTLQPWDIQIKPTQEAIAAENRLAVLYFQNLADPADSTGLAPVVTNLLITDLTQTGTVDIVSTSRLYDIARMMNLAAPADLNHSRAEEVGRRSRSRWVLLGSIVSTQPNWTLTAQLVDVATGDIVASFDQRGTPEGEIFPVIDNLSREIGAHFGLTDEVSGAGVLISQVTSPSLDAYRHYLTGVDQFHRLYYREAIGSFQTALQLDPEMAMAYCYLGRLLDRSLMDQAVKYIDRAGKVEQHYIRYYASRLRGEVDSSVAELHRAVELFPQEKQAWLFLANNARATGQQELAAGYYERVIELDSLDRSAYNGLAYSYHLLGKPDRALWAADRYIDVASDEPNPYDTKGDILSLNGYLHEAIESYGKAVEINPDFHHSRMYLGYMYMFDGQYARADSCFQALSFQSEPSLRYAAPMYAIYPWLRRGKLDTALVLIDELEALVSTDHALRLVPDNRARAHFLRAIVYRERHDLAGAIAEIARARRQSELLATHDSVSYRSYYIQLLTENGDMEAARRELMAFEQYVTRVDSDVPSYWHAAAFVSLHSGNCDSAQVQGKRAAEINPHFQFMVAAAEVTLACENYEDAADMLELLLIPYTSPRSFHAIESTKLHYYLGQAYEGLGRFNEAVTQYETFLDIWHEADEDIDAITDVRVRLARLRS